MAKFILDFERPVIELEQKIESLRAQGDEKSLKEAQKLEEELVRLREKIFKNLTPWQRVQLARHPDRPYTRDYIKYMLDWFIELHGDGCFSDDKAVICGIGKLDKYHVVLIGQQKGRDTKERIERNFGMMHPEGYRKAIKFMKLGAKFGRPIITLIDTAGAYPGIGAEERGQAQAIARNLFEMAKLPVPIICVVTGEGGSGGALGIGVGDRIIMLEFSFYSVISPEGCASILWRDAKKAPDAAAALKITAQELYKLGIADRIVEEPPGGAHRDPKTTALNLKKAIVEELDKLKDISYQELIKQRIEKYGRMGVYRENGKLVGSFRE